MIVKGDKSLRRRWLSHGNISFFFQTFTLRGSFLYPHKMMIELSGF